MELAFKEEEFIFFNLRFLGLSLELFCELFSVFRADLEFLA